MRSSLIPFVLFVLLVSPGASRAVEWWVAPDGDDAHAGTRAQPFATLERAREAIRVTSGEPRDEPVTVHVRAGTYRLARAIEFGEADSGSAAAPITWQAEPAGSVRLTGGREVSQWHAIEDPEAYDRLLPETRECAVVAELWEQGFTDLGELTQLGWSMDTQPAPAELFYDDQPMSLARWPNRGFRRVTAAPDLVNIEVDTDRMERWANEPAPWVMAYWHADWAELLEPLAGFDPPRRVLLRRADIRPGLGIVAENARWYVCNVLAELDTPGEYYLDRLRGRLYFWPPHPEGRAELSVAHGLLRADGLSHVTFRGFTLEACRASAIEIRGGADCHVVGCTIRNTGLRGVRIEGGTGHEVFGCDIYFTGEEGIAMTGGDRETLTPARHNAENNDLHHFARRKRTYRPGVHIDGVGCRVAHNRIHDAPHMALDGWGNDHLIEFNEIHNVVEESGDAGAFYAGCDWTQRGTVLRYNYWHQISGPTSYGGMTVYLDDQLSGQTMHGNVFERCSQAVFIGGGDDNIVTNNLFLRCRGGVLLDKRGMSWQQPISQDVLGILYKRLRAVPYTSPVWRERYPALARMLDHEPGEPRGNVISGNLSAGGSFNYIDRSVIQWQTVRANYARDDDADWIRLVCDDTGQPVALEFRDLEAAVAAGFEPLPLEKMGLYADPRRASWPVERLVRPVRMRGEK